MENVIQFFFFFGGTLSVLIFRHVCEIAKSDSFIMFIRPHGTVLLPPDGFSWNFICEYFPKLCQVSVWLKIWQDWQTLKLWVNGDIKYCLYKRVCLIVVRVCDFIVTSILLANENRIIVFPQCDIRTLPILLGFCAADRPVLHSALSFVKPILLKCRTDLHYFFERAMGPMNEWSLQWSTVFAGKRSRWSCSCI